MPSTRELHHLKDNFIPSRSSSTDDSIPMLNASSISSSLSISTTSPPSNSTLSPTTSVSSQRSKMSTSAASSGVATAVHDIQDPHSSKNRAAIGGATASLA